jgi:hypothetical protein
MPKGAAWPGQAACPGEEKHAPGRSSMPLGGAVERAAWPEGVASSGKQYAKGGQFNRTLRSILTCIAFEFERLLFSNLKPETNLSSIS